MQALITTSWDDGHPADSRVAEMLSRYGLTGTFYIPRKIETGVMPDQEIRNLAQRFEIGAHTLNHVFLADADDATAQSEIAGSKKWVEDVTGCRCPMFCPPAGRFRPSHLPMFREAGFIAFRSVEFMSFDRPRSGMNQLLEMPTTMQAFPQPAWGYAKNVAKRKSVGGMWRLLCNAGSTRDWPRLVERLLERALQQGGVFHLWGHSWELEQKNQWAQLDVALKMLAQAKSQATCLTNGQICEQMLAQTVGVRRQTAAA